MADAAGIDARVLVVDDGSPDGTADARRGRRPPATRGSRCCGGRARRGSGRRTAPASAARWTRARGLVVEMDCDFSHDPARLPDPVAATADADLVLGSRYVPGGGVARWGAVRRSISRAGCEYARADPGRGRARPHRRLQVLPPRGARGHPARRGDRRRVRVPDRDDLPRPGARASAWWRCRSPSPSASAGRSKMSRRIVWEAAALVPRLRRRLGPVPRGAARRRPGPASPLGR